MEFNTECLDMRLAETTFGPERLTIFKTIIIILLAVVVLLMQPSWAVSADPDQRPVKRLWVAPTDLGLWLVIEPEPEPESEDKTAGAGSTGKIQMGFTSDRAKWRWKKLNGRAESIAAAGEALIVHFEGELVTRVEGSRVGSLPNLPRGYRLDLLAADADRTRLFALAKVDPLDAPADEPGHSRRIWEYKLGKWQVLADLPESLTAAAKIRFAIQAGRIDLVARHDADTFTHWTFEEDRWVRAGEFSLPQPVDRLWLGLGSTDDDLVLVTATDQPQNNNLSLHRLKSSGELVTVGPLEFSDGQRLPTQTILVFDVALAADRLVLAWAEDAGPIKLAWFDRFGRQSGELIEVSPPEPIAPAKPSGIWSLIVLAMLIVLMLFTRALRPVGTLALPEGFAVADYWRRGLAAIIDLIPILILATLVLRIWYPELIAPNMTLDQMMNQAHTDGRFMWTGIFVSCTYAAYCMAAEMLWLATPGKMLFGLQVRSVRSPETRPTAVQIVVRNAVKILELNIAPLLFVMFIYPLRQRMGDIFAGTMVVQRLASPREYS